MDTVTDRAFAAALYGDGDDGLDTGASLLAADPGSDPELGRRGEEFLRRAWQRGWQPADVSRLVRRDLTERHTRLLAELIAAEVRAYDRLPPRWQAQLDELVDPAGETAGAGRRADRFSYATAVLELYRLLLRLPTIEPVGAAPGAAAQLPPHHHAEPRMLTRIRALLAKAEATDYAAEAEALSAKAQELMARHSIDEARLSAEGRSADTPAACRIGVDAPYETAKAVLLDAVATANRCRAVWNSAFGFSTVVGFEPDLEVVELLHTSLLVQGTAAMTRAESAQRAGGRKRTKTFRQSFLAAYASRLGHRLAETAGQVTAAEAGSLLPVLAARDVAVVSEAERMFPATTTSRVRGVSDEAGWTEGTAAADAARVG
ncbi:MULTISPECIES: DUF2786 domain-containing protein [unclassified Streptomyces]|uniref:DUF2786 domain-containing protein n=1 Tax=unclassified Streptomyces TaxID=2593676 RepID=UPI00224FF0D3|nr:MULTISPECIES: DUF2786 domain-containing protein [unclassified Streptomyces]MCX4549178.1 DUF2786 domain-containing protein [Streptomyces sp. NBC_01500]WSC20749.1 DUF2786 domain-containing protein [Streptomyces sp. NBC_01766]